MSEEVRVNVVDVDVDVAQALLTDLDTSSLHYPASGGIQSAKLENHPCCDLDQSAVGDGEARCCRGSGGRCILKWRGPPPSWGSSWFDPGFWQVQTHNQSINQSNVKCQDKNETCISILHQFIALRRIAE